MLITERGGEKFYLIAEGAFQASMHASCGQKLRIAVLVLDNAHDDNDVLARRGKQSG